MGRSPRTNKEYDASLISLVGCLFSLIALGINKIDPSFPEVIFIFTFFLTLILMGYYGLKSGVIYFGNAAWNIGVIKATKKVSWGFIIMGVLLLLVYVFSTLGYI